MKIRLTKALILALLMAAPSWAAYGYKRAITIDHTKVGSAAHTDFPVLVSGTYSYLATTANGGRLENASGYDVDFFSDSALTTPLSWERKRHVLTTGEVVFWVKVPSVSNTTDTVIYMAMGDSGVTTDQSDSADVWDSSFKGVWHLEDDPSGSSPQMQDSTSNSNHLTTAGTMTSGDSVAGKAGNSLDLDGTDDYAYKTDNASLSPTAAFTASGWFNQASLAATRVLFCKNSSSVFSWSIRTDSTDNTRLIAYISETSGDTSRYARTAAGAWSTGWHHVAMVYYGAGADNAAKLALYIDGASVSLTFTGTMPTAVYDNNVPFTLGSQYGYARYFNGKADEIRFSSVNRSSAWVTAEYNNQNSPSTFYAVGDETAVGGGSRRRFIIIAQRRAGQ